MNTALLLIDIQNDYFEGGRFELVNAQQALANTKIILNQFRKKELPVIHVQHINLMSNAPFFSPDTEGVKIHKELTPAKGEYWVVKHAPNSFYRTSLLDILKEKNISHLIVCGMMSHMCIDSTVRAARDHNVQITLIDDACATRDLMFDNEVIPACTVHNAYMAALNGTFAKLVKAADFN